VLSFVIPTLAGRRDDARRCVGALSRELGAEPAEILLVVEDEAHAAAFAATPTGGAELRTVVRRGGAAARRNAAFAVLRGDVVALLDDDAEPLPGYGAALRERFADRAPKVVQGAVWPAFDVEPPPAIVPVLFSVGGFNRHGEARREDVFISANCAFSREVLAKVGPMREDLGPGSGGAAWGDDTDWHLRATAAGFPTQFDERLAVRHRIQAERLTEAYVLERAERVGRTRARLEWRDRRPGAGALLRQRGLALWARAKGGGIAGACLARRLAGYADELARIRRGSVT
jgi:GT2 family glycosyltransferase